MKKLDKYIVKSFLGTFIFTVLLLLMIAIVINISEKLRRMLTNGVTLMEALEYYVHFSLFYSNVFMSIVVFISVIFVTSKLAANSEIIAMKSSGITYDRLLYPYMIVATILFVVTLVVNHWILPKSNEQRNIFEYKYLSSNTDIKKLVKSSDISKKISDNEYIFLGSFNAKTKSGYNFIYEKFDDKNNLKTKISSQIIRWDSIKNQFKLINYRSRNILLDIDKINSGKSKDTILGFTPKDLLVKSYKATTLNYTELNEFIDSEKKQGSDRVLSYLLEKHRRTSMPFSTYILTIIGVALSSTKRRGGTGINIALGIVLAFVYIFFMRLSDAIAIDRKASALVSVWIPNIIFAVLAVVLHIKTRRR